MNLLTPRTIMLAASLAMIVIRAPHGRRSRQVPVAKSRRGSLELILLTFAWTGFILPLVWIASPVLDFAAYRSAPALLAAGTACLIVGLWLLYRSHADLGTNWSITLEVRENHALVTGGVYRSIRHPMYSAFLLHGLGAALVVPNWLAGPAYLVAFALLFVLRVGPEEAMMREQFGAAYEAYMGRTKRLVPRIW